MHRSCRGNRVRHPAGPQFRFPEDQQRRAALHQDGVREFDLSIGNYAFKRRFGATPLPLSDVSVALGWRGIPYVLRDRAAQRLRRHPWLAEKVARALGKLSRDEE